MKKTILSFIFFFAWRKAVIIFLALLFFSNHLTAQAPPIQWQKCLGGSADDLGLSMQQTSDGGYILSGNTVSFDGDVSGWHGSFDYWVVKTDGSGNIQWQKCLGGSGMDLGRGIHQTTDGGYIVTGDSYSNDGDVSGNHGGGDAWVVKLDASGNIQWQKCLGGSGSEVFRNVDQSADGGYIVVGSTASSDGDVSGHHSNTNNYDYWIVKLDPSGNIQWQKCLGGLNDDIGYNINLTSDGGYIVSGYSYSNDGDVSDHHGSANYYDYWIVKLDASGNIQWQKSLGGSMDDIAHPVRQTSDGGYIAAGYTDSNDGDVSGNHGNGDEWVVKLDASGSIQWQKCLGGSNHDEVHFITQTTDGGYIVSGFSYSNDGDVNGNHGSSDAWVVKLNTSGNIQWQKCLGGTGDESAFRVRETTDGGYAVGGWTQSYDGDVSGNRGRMDYWLVKLTGCTMAQPGPITGNINGYCSGSSQNYSIAAVIGATGYTWAVPNGWTINSGQGTTSVTVTTGTNGGNISVTVNYSCGSITKTLAVAGASPMVTPQISIVCNLGNNICTGSPVTFTATPANGGSSPSYQWKINGNNFGTNSSTYTTNSLANGDIVSCILTSNASCLTTNPANSNTITMAVNNSVTPTISISSSSTNICAGSGVTLTATPVNGGNSPAYQWKINGNNAGTNSPTFTSNSLTNGQVVSCMMTSTLACANPATVTSNNISITINPPVVPAITISQISCNGNTIGFTANTTNGGSNPSYLWSFTGTGTATNFTGSNFTLNNAANGTQVQCRMTSNAACANPVQVTSTPLTVTCVASGVVSPPNLNFRVHPNPANQNATITFYLGASVRISLDVVNSLGQQITILEDRVLNSGNQTIPLNTEKLAAGVYFIRLRTVNYKIARKLVVIH